MNPGMIKMFAMPWQAMQLKGKKVVVSGLWTEVCNTHFALSAMADTDYEIYMVADASGGTSAIPINMPWIVWYRRA